MLTSPEIFTRQEENDEGSAPSLRERLQALLGRSSSAPTLDVSRLSDRMLRDLNLPVEFHPDRNPRGRP